MHQIKFFMNMRIRRKFTLIRSVLQKGASLFCIFLCVACGDEGRNTLVVGTKIDGLSTLDPAEVFEFSGMEYIYNTYNTLVRHQPQNPKKLEGEVAQKWSVSHDGKTITFKIRSDILFASGNPLTAYDVAFSLQRAVLLGRQPSQLITQFGFTADNVRKNIRALDETTLLFRMDDRYSEVLVLYCLSANISAIVDRKEVLMHEVNGDFGNAWLKTHHAGSGAFSLKSWTPNHILTLKANPHYFRGKPSLKEVAFRHVSETATAILMLKKGDVDLLNNMEFKQEQLEELRGAVTFERVSQGFTRYLLLNQKNPHLQIPEVQQAIRHLINYEGIVSLVSKDASFVHQTFIPRGFFGELHENPYDFDVPKARALLKKVGLLDKLTFTLETPHSEIGQALQAGFREGGIHLRINYVDNKQLLTRVRERRYDIGFCRWIPDYFDPHANATTFTRNSDNSDETREKTIAWRATLDLPKLTEMTEQAMKESDPEKRAALYRTLQKRMLTSPIINMFQEDTLVLVRDDVQGIEFSRAGNKVLYENVEKN